MFLHNLLNVLVQIANKIGLQKKILDCLNMGSKQHAYSFVAKVFATNFADTSCMGQDILSGIFMIRVFCNEQ
jgi:hypothetical protein